MTSIVQDDECFFYGISDRVFKVTLFDGMNNDVTKWFLEKILDIKVNSFSIVNNELNMKKRNDRLQVVDVLVIINDELLCNIEVNTRYKQIIHDRNFSYGCKLYSKIFDETNSKKNGKLKQLIHVDLTLGLPNNKYDNIKNLMHVQDDNCSKYLRNFVFIEIDVDKAMKYWYNQDEKLKDYAYLIMLMLGRSDLNKLISMANPEDKKFIRQYRKDVISVNEYQGFLDILTDEKEKAKWDRLILEDDIKDAKIEARREGLAEGRLEGRLEGIKEGIEEANISAIQNMARENISADVISRCVKMPLEKVNKILASIIL